MPCLYITEFSQCSIDLYSKIKWKILLIFEFYRGKQHRNWWNNITQMIKDRQEKDGWRVLVNRDWVVRTINYDNRKEDKWNICKLCPWQAWCLAYLRYKKRIDSQKAQLCHGLMTKLSYTVPVRKFNQQTNKEEKSFSAFQNDYENRSWMFSPKRKIRVEQLIMLL